jgi:hypothetical protein
MWVQEFVPSNPLVLYCFNSVSVLLAPSMRVSFGLIPVKLSGFVVSWIGLTGLDKREERA